MSILTGRKLPILMYHQVSDSRKDGLTVPAGMLDQQLRRVSEKGYTTISFQTLKESMETGRPLPGRPLILTFDDAYGNFLTHACPLLKKFRMQATVFIPVAFIGKTNIWDRGHEPILKAEQLRQLWDEGCVELGIHSFLHKSYAELSVEDMKEDLDNCFNTLRFHNIRFSPVLAYPYGGFPKKDPELKQQMKTLFTTLQLWFAVRIGNRINPLPVKDPYELNRIDIRGTDSFRTFSLKLSRGRTHPFA